MPFNHILKKFFSKFIFPVFIVFLSITLTVTAAEFVLSHFTRMGKYEKWMGKNEGYFHFTCYTSDPKGYFPYTVWDSETKQYVYCIMYDNALRERGFYPEREKSAALIGDSFVFGQGVRDKDTLAYYLSQKSPKINFRNFGHTGAYTKQIYEDFTNIIKVHKDIKQMIYFYNLNDMLMSPEIRQRHKFIMDFENIFWHSAERKPDKLPEFITQSTIYHMLRKAFIIREESDLTVKHYLDMYFDPANGKERAESIQHLIDMNKIALEKGITFYVVIYPLLYKDLLGRYPLRKIHAFLLEICRENQISCFDAYPAFERDYSLKKYIVHPIDYHPNGLCNKTVVDYLAQQPAFKFE